MADFGVNATALSAPQGQGATPVDAVETRAVNTSMIGTVSKLGDMFADGVKHHVKEEAEKVKNGVVGEYSRKIKQINDALTTGQMKPAEASARRRAINSEYSGGYSQYIEEFTKVANFNRGNTEVGEAEDTEKAAKDFQKKRKEYAQGRGFTFYEGMSRNTEEAQMEAAETSKREEDKLAAFYKSAEYRRAEMGAFRAESAENRSVFEFDQKNMAGETIRAIGGSNLTAFQSFIADLSSKVRGNQMPPEQAQLLMQERFSNIKSGLAAAAGVNPGLTANWDSVFQGLNELGLKMIDPKNAAEDLKSMFEFRVNQGKLLALNSSPQAYSAIVTDRLFTNPTVQLNIASHVDTIMKKLSQTAPGNFAPTVVGDPEVEADALKLLKAGLKNVNAGKVVDKDAAELQASTSVNHILKQTSKLMDGGQVNPAAMKNVAEFFASPEYASFVSKGNIDKEAAGAAKRAFELLYEPAIVDGVGKRLSAELFSPNANATGFKPTKVSEVVEVRFSGSGISFVPKGKSGLLDVELRNQMEAVNSLKSAQQGVNQLIRIGAHMEGTTNYAQYWEKNKHLYFPGMFPTPDQSAPPKPANKPTKTASAGGTKNWWED